MEERSAGRDRRVVLAACLSAYAGLVHLYVAWDHVGEWWGYIAFFGGVGVAQVLFAPLVVRTRSALVCLLGVAANVAVVCVYVVSRTAGATVIERHTSHDLGLAGALDLVVTAVEVGLVAILVALVPGRAGRIGLNVALLAGVTLWGLRLAGPLS